MQNRAGRRPEPNLKQKEGCRMNKILLRGRMIDAVSDTPVEDAAVLIEGDRIAYAGPYEN